MGEGGWSWWSVPTKCEYNNIIASRLEDCGNRPKVFITQVTERQKSTRVFGECTRTSTRDGTSEEKKTPVDAANHEAQHNFYLGVLQTFLKRMIDRDT